MSNEIPEIEPCVCGIYPSVYLEDGEAPTPGKNLYKISLNCYSTKINCDNYKTYNQERRKLPFSQCIAEWNTFIKQEKFKRAYSVSEKDWQAKTYEEYIDARKSIIALYLSPPLYNEGLDIKQKDKLFNIIEKFFCCEFLSEAAKEVGYARNPENRKKIMEKYFNREGISYEQ